VIAALGIGRYVAAEKAKPAVNEAKAAEPEAQGQRAAEFIAAFNAGDAKELASLWTLEGDYVDQAGEVHKGRPALEKMYSKYFAENKGAVLTVTLLSKKAVGDSVILEDGITTVTPADGGPGTVGRFSAVFVWRCWSRISLASV
jgi:uncharacterized protein (TIGR02246 family)